VLLCRRQSAAEERARTAAGPRKQQPANRSTSHCAPKTVRLASCGPSQFGSPTGSSAGSLGLFWGLFWTSSGRPKAARECFRRPDLALGRQRARGGTEAEPERRPERWQRVGVAEESEKLPAIISTRRWQIRARVRAAAAHSLRHTVLGLLKVRAWPQRATSFRASWLEALLWKAPLSSGPARNTRPLWVESHWLAAQRLPCESLEKHAQRPRSTGAAQWRSQSQSEAGDLRTSCRATTCCAL